MRKCDQENQRHLATMRRVRGHKPREVKVKAVRRHRGAEALGLWGSIFAIRAMDPMTIRKVHDGRPV